LIEDKQYAFILAVRHNYIEVVKLLLQDKNVDPSYDDNWAIDYASFYRYDEVVELLIHDSRVMKMRQNRFISNI